MAFGKQGIERKAAGAPGCPGRAKRWRIGDNAHGEHEFIDDAFQ
jgi:hypothetical protein